MRPVEFPEQNVVFAKDQPEYLPLPARRLPNGDVTSCWKADIWERIGILITGRVHVHQLTFNQPLQPLLVTVTAQMSGGCERGRP